MTDTVRLSMAEVRDLSLRILSNAGLSDAQAEAMTRVIAAGQRDECHSHGLYRLMGCARSVKEGKVDPVSVPEIHDPAPGIVKVDAKFGFSPLAFEMGLPILKEKARKQGIAALAINNCFHFSALWPEVEQLGNDGLAGLAMTPSHSWVAPAGGTQPVFGTNPIAFAWPRPDSVPFVFDFATSATARGEIELHRRSGQPIPLGWAVDAEGKPTTDATEALAGAMLTFGGHKGSALSAMVELLAGPLIGDMTSAESMAFDAGAGVAPCHGELIIALDPASFLGAAVAQNLTRAEALFEGITSQGARLPSQRRYDARLRSDRDGVSIPAKLYEDLQAYLPA
ncbi:Ldh family oxidoreductase [Pararhizobium sp.]|uniref:Ldh family oxidoreductase n=1 Tax=Pararhizobium sp. TaxID=1977563 RepID=UPI00272156CB|nr:Ldh family oxidoreductase [Pararhizobium sp.]MDO9416157.1 Ldh family oxidoreductase [Pararhizobium sp.]